MDRRELLKMFGIGAVVAPVVNGVALATDHAKIIKPPTVEIAAPPRLVECNASEFFINQRNLEITLFAKDPVTNRVMRMDCDAFMSRFSFTAPAALMMQQSIDFTVTGPVRFVQK